MNAAIAGNTNSSARNTYVTSLTERSKCAAITSLPPGEEEHEVEGEHRDADGGADRAVARAVEEVVLGVVLGEALLDVRPEVEDRERDAGEQHAGEERVRDLEAAEPQLPRRHEAQRAFEPADVPVGLRACAHGRGLERAVEPHRVDLHQPTERGADREDEEEQAERLRRERRPELGARRRCVSDAALAGELRVLLAHEHHEVEGQEADDRRGDDQHMDDEQARDDVVARELAAEHEERSPRPEQRDRKQHRVGDAQAGSREQVVREAVAGEPVRRVRAGTA